MIRARDLKEGQVWRIGKLEIEIDAIDAGLFLAVNFWMAGRDYVSMEAKNFVRFLTLAGAKLVKEGK